MRQDPPKNVFLRRLPLQELQRLCPFLVRMDIVPGERLPEPGGLGGVWFPECGLISVLVRDDHGVETEVAMVGGEGAAKLDGPRRHDGSAIWHLLAQHRGHAHVLSAENLPTALTLSSTLSSVLMAAAALLLDQTAATAHANAHGRVLERFARWLLLAHDRIDGDELNFTHQMVAAMLGVRRVGVTDAIHRLEGERLIKSHRGRITITDRPGLVAATKGLYQPVHPTRPYAKGYVTSDGDGVSDTADGRSDPTSRMLRSG